MDKSEIRKKIFKIRKQNDLKNLSINFNHILNIIDKYKFLNSSVGGYYPYNYEIDVIEILKKFEKKNYQISLPKINKNFQMDFFHWTTQDPLEINKYGIPEPSSDKVIYPSILLVPIVAFDNDNNRVGYGGGFYDRYLNKIKKKKRLLRLDWLTLIKKLKKYQLINMTLSWTLL